MNNSRLVFKSLFDTETATNDLVYSLNTSNDCIQIECGTNANTQNLNTLKKPPAFNLNAPPDPIAMLSLSELNSLDLYAKNNNPENFLLHLLNADNKMGQCVDLRLQMTTLGLKKYYDLKTTTGSILKQHSFSNKISNRFTISLNQTKLSTITMTSMNNSTVQAISGLAYSNSNLLHFVLLSFMSLFCLLLILVLFYFLIQRKKFTKNTLSLVHHNSINNEHNHLDQLEHLYHQHSLVHKSKDPNLSNLEQTNNNYNINQFQHLLLKQQLQIQNDLNPNQHYISSNNGLPISTSLLTFDWLNLTKQNGSNGQYPQKDIQSENKKKKLTKKYSDTQRKSNTNQQTEMKLLQQPLLDTAVCNLNAANSTLSTRATVTASSSSSSSSSVSSSIIKNDQVNHYQKLYPKMMNQATDNLHLNNYSVGSSNEMSSAYNNLLLQNIYNGTLLNKTSCGYNKVALLCNTNDPNGPPQLVKILNLNPDIAGSNLCDCLQMINLDTTNSNCLNVNQNHLLFETNHYENYRNMVNNSTNKRFSQVIEPIKLPVENSNNEQFYELIDDNVNSNNYSEWIDSNLKSKQNVIRQNSLHLNTSFNTKRKYPKTNPNYSQSNYASMNSKNNGSMNGNYKEH